MSERIENIFELCTYWRDRAFTAQKDQLELAEVLESLYETLAGLKHVDTEIVGDSRHGDGDPDAKGGEPPVSLDAAQQVFPIAPAKLDEILPAGVSVERVAALRARFAVLLQLASGCAGNTKPEVTH